MDWLIEKVNAGLQRRRAREKDMFLRAIYPGGAVPVWGVDEKGNVIWSAIRHISRAEWMGSSTVPVAQKPGSFAAFIAWLLSLATGRGTCP